MDRTLKVYTQTGHLFAEFTFLYEQLNQAKAKYIQYRRLYNYDEEDENKSVYPIMEMDVHLNYRQFDSIDQIKAHDKEIVKNYLGRDMIDARGYNYVYNNEPVLLRYIAANHIGFIGMVNITFSFIDNTKEVKFLSGTNPRYDTELTSNSLETNISCILKVPVYTDRDVISLSLYDLKRLPPWY
jgi:hypothetical protein